jgi:hypothetical protein
MRPVLPALAAVLLLCACPFGTGGNGGGSDAGSGGIDGKLTVHVGGLLESATPPPPDGGAVPDGGTGRWVMLGEGTRWKTQLVAGDTVVFQDPAIKGPQTVTLAGQTISGSTRAITVVDVNRDDVWLDNGATDSGGGGGPTPYCTWTGNVSGFAAGAIVTVRAVGDQVSAKATAQANGDYTLSIFQSGPFTGTVDILAVQEPVQPDDPPVKLALRRGVALPAQGQTVTGLDLPLDHAFDGAFTVNVAGDVSGYTVAPGATLAWYDGKRSLFSSQSDARGNPVTLRSLGTGGDFDDLQRRLTVVAGTSDDLGKGAARVRAWLSSGVNAQEVKFLGPAAISSPAVGPQSAPGAGALANLEVTWTADASALAVTGELQSRGTPGWRWQWAAPAGRGRFKPFALPAEVSTVSSAPAALYRIDVASYQYGAASSYSDLFAPTPPIDTGISRDTDIRGYANLN